MGREQGALAMQSLRCMNPYFKAQLVINEIPPTHPHACTPQHMTPGMRGTNLHNTASVRCTEECRPFLHLRL